MEKKNPNIYQRALDIVNHRINPDIPQGGGGSSDAIQYIPQTLTEEQQMQARKNQGLYYEEDTVGYLLEETTLAFDGEISTQTIGSVVPMVVGENYILTRDGIEYEVTAESLYGAYVFIGFNPAEEPSEAIHKVCIAAVEDEGITMVIELEAGSHTYSIRGNVHALSAIDKKYVMPAFEDYMTLLTPRDGIVFNWDGNIAEAEIEGWKERWDGSHSGYVKLADDFPEDDAWIKATMLQYGSIPSEGGSWTQRVLYNGGYLLYAYGSYVLEDYALVFVLGESTPVGPDISLPHGIWTRVIVSDDEVTGFYKVEFPKIKYTIERFAGHQGTGLNSFVCCGGGAGTASGDNAVNGGAGCVVSGDGSAAFGESNRVESNRSFASGYGNVITGSDSHAEGSAHTIHGSYSHTEGSRNTVNKGVWYAHAEGTENTAQFDNEHIEGRYNEQYDMTQHTVYDENTTYYPGDIVTKTFSSSTTLYMCIKQCKGQDPGVSNSEYWQAGYNPFVHVVGWGRRASDGTITRKNIHTIDSLGNAMYTGDVTAKSMIIQSSTPDSTKKFKITVDDTGAITATEVT